MSLFIPLEKLSDIFFKQKDNNTIQSLGFNQEKAKWLEELGYTFEDIKSRIDEGFTPQEIENAVVVKQLHDKVEIAAYQALQKGVIELKLIKAKRKRLTIITDSESNTLLHKYIKTAAHKVMRARDGYINQRMNYLNQRQIEPVINRVPDITEDRDKKLTNATYGTLEELENALDTHNSFVNQILFNAWGVPNHTKNHLEDIKSQAGYQPLN